MGTRVISASDLERILLRLLDLLRDTQFMQRSLPKTRVELEERLRCVAAALGNISELHLALLRRVLLGAGELSADSLPSEERDALLEETCRATSPSKNELEQLLATMTSELNLTDEEFASLPKESSSVGRFLAICLALEVPLADHLEVDLAVRLHPQPVPPEALRHFARIDTRNADNKG